jgi:hypothetical protein
MTSVTLIRRAALFLFLAGALDAQDVGTIRGENVGNYNITDSFETGYRFATVGGDVGKYQSDVNYGNGIRLLSGSFTANSRDGHGKWFDELDLTTQGLGNDPYESVSLRVEKNRLYEYDFSWRQNSYYNPGLTVDAGQHFEDLVQRTQDHDITIFPQRWYRIHAGFSDWNEQGPALSTLQLFDDQGNEFPLFSNVKRRSYTYRLGGDIDFRGWHFTVMKRWEDFRDDTPYTDNLFEPGNNPVSPTTLSSLQLNQPYHGTTSGWLANLNTTQRHFAVNAHVNYDNGIRNFLFDELALGTDELGAARQQETFAAGNAKRPLLVGDLTLSLMATARLTIVNNTSVQNTRIDGTSLLDQFDNATLSNNVLNFQFLGIRTIGNSTDIHYAFSKRFSASIGYQNSTRLVRSIEEGNTPGLPDSTFALTGHQTNRLNAGTAGLNWLILKPLRFRVQGEVGSNSNPFFPISERNYHAIDARLQLRLKTFQAAAGYKELYNNNSIDISAYSSHSRDWFGDISWTGNRRVGLDLSYSQLHLDTLGGVAFFAGVPSQEVQSVSEYVSNLHVANAVVHISGPKRADFFIGYTITRDTGDSAASPVSADPVDALLFSVQAFPLSFQSPYARVSVRITPKLKWNFSYQYYGYHEDVHLFGFDQDYRANTGTVSLLWAF